MPSISGSRTPGWICPRIYLTDHLVGVLLVVVALRNGRAAWVNDESWAVKRVAHCARLTAVPSETIAFFAPSQPDVPLDELPSVRPLFNVQPSVRFYANRHMHTLYERQQVARWLRDGGRLVWSDTLGAHELAGLVLPVVRVGNQQLSSLDESTLLLDACRPNSP